MTDDRTIEESTLVRANLAPHWHGTTEEQIQLTPIGDMGPTSAYVCNRLHRVLLLLAEESSYRPAYLSSYEEERK